MAFLFEKGENPDPPLDDGVGLRRIGQAGERQLQILLRQKAPARGEVVAPVAERLDARGVIGGGGRGGVDIRFEPGDALGETRCLGDAGRRIERDG